MQHEISMENELKTILADCSFFSDAVCFSCLESTNTYATQLALSGAREGTIVLAREQTRGRGRMGRTFYSPAETGLYMSLVLRPKLPAAEWEILTACAAVAVHSAILEITGKKTKIKWVNDLYYDGKKLCGILAEGRFHSDGKLLHLILGIGVNLSPPAGGYHEEIAGKTISLQEMAPASKVDAVQLCAAVVRHFSTIYQALPSREFLEIYRKESCLLGKEISFVQGDRKFMALAEEIDDQARLCVQMADGTRQILSAGEVMLVRPQEITNERENHNEIS